MANIDINNTCVYLLEYHCKAKFGLDLYSNDLYFYYNDELVYKSSYIFNKNLLYLVIDKTIEMKFERFDDVIPSIKIDGKLFRLADNKMKNRLNYLMNYQNKFFDELDMFRKKL